MMPALGRSAQVSSGQLGSKLSPPPLLRSSVKISQHVTLNITQLQRLWETLYVGIEEVFSLGVCIFYEGY